jgi:hypothetical protein
MEVEANCPISREIFGHVYIRYICARDRKGTLHGKRSVYCSKKNTIYLEK